MENVILCIGSEQEEDPAHLFSVRQFSVHDKMNAPFEINLLCVSPYFDLDIENIVGSEATFSLYNAIEIWRGYSGLVKKVEQVRVEVTGAGQGQTHYAVTLVPELWRLSQRRNHRIFQHMTTQQIVDQLLDEWQIDREWYLDRQDYPTHEYKVQYGETDLDFLHRLLEEAGISYYFYDDPEDEDVESHLQFDDTPETSDLRAGDPIPYVDNPNESQGGGEYVTEVTLMHDVRPGKVTIRDFDFRRRPDTQLFGTTDPAPSPEDAYEHYFYDPNGFLYDTDKADGNTPVADDHSKARHLDSEGDDEAEIVFEQLRVGKRHVSYRTNCHDLSPGMRFEMVHPRGDLGGEDLLSIEAHIFGKHDGEWVLYGHAVFADDPYKPAIRTTKPRVHGLQTAIVCGPPGEEIYTDEFGRVRVRFMWDREGDFDDDRTCWLRVSQDWGGAAFGGQRIPRIDQEVLVDFLEGDPDNPIIVGRLFNNTNRVVYPLPARKTVSAYKSDTSPHDGGFNEVTFEDKAGGEYVFIQAQKDLWKLVKHDESETTGHDRTIQIAQNQNTVIGQNDLHTIGTRHDVAVGSTRIQKVDKKITATVGEATITLDGPNITIVANSDLTFSALGEVVIQGGPNVYINCDDVPAELWQQYSKEAHDIMKTVAANVPAKDKIIQGAFAAVAIGDPTFVYAGMVATAAPLDASEAAGAAASEVGAPTDDLLLDLYPMYKLYADQGADGLAAAAGVMPAWGQDAFAALASGDVEGHVRELATQQAVDLQQQAIYGGAAPAATVGAQVGSFMTTKAAAYDPGSADLGAVRDAGIAAGGVYP